jgi:thioesterase III
MNQIGPEILFAHNNSMIKQMKKEDFHRVMIRESHLDSYGHVNNATYLTLFEEARWEFVTRKDYSHKDIHRLKKGPIILEVTIKFLKEITLRENIDISMDLLDYNGKIGRLGQKMFKSDGSIAADAIFVFGLFDLNARKLIEPTDAWKYAVGLTDTKPAKN